MAVKNKNQVAASTPKQSTGKQETLVRHLRKYWQWYAMMLIPVVYYIIFRYVPMIGNIIAFRKYRAGSSILGDEWSGFKYFKQFINDKNFWRAFRNTLLLNFKYLLISFPLTIVFALLLNEVKNVVWKKTVQTISYLPHFISLVIMAGMVRELLSTNGPINHLIVSLGGQSITFISLPEWFTTIFVVSGIWQGIGWGTILYLAAMAGISPELYEAASLDGANKFKQCIHVTLPAIMPTIATLLVLNIGQLCGSAAFEKVMLLYQPTTYETADIIGTYVYRMGLTSGNYSYATAVGLFQGIINLVLLTAANQASKKMTGSGLY